MIPDELDYGAHRTCAWCGKLHPQKRMLHYDQKWFCSIQHYLLHLNLKGNGSEDNLDGSGVAPVDDRSLDI